MLTKYANTFPAIMTEVLYRISFLTDIVTDSTIGNVLCESEDEVQHNNYDDLICRLPNNTGTVIKSKDYALISTSK